MKIGIILNPYGEVSPGGLARTILEWSRGMLQIDQENQYIVFLKSSPKILPDLPGNNWRMEVLGSGIFWLNRLRGASLADVYIFQTPVLPLFFKPKKSVIIAQDFPYLYPRVRRPGIRARLRNLIVYFYHAFSLKKADAVIAVSDSTKDDLIKNFKVPENKITVIHMGFKKICDTPEVLVALPSKFFLFTGVVKERKNVLNIAKAFGKFKKGDTNGYKLVLAGKTEGEYFMAVKKYLEEKNLSKEVIFLGFLNDGQLAHVYKRATALLFPSLVEGFGFPVLEAMDCGIPVITSNIFGPKELGGDAAILVDPYNVDEMARAIQKLAADPALRDDLIKKGFLRAKKFDWKDTARKTLKLIYSL